MMILLLPHRSSNTTFGESYSLTWCRRKLIFLTTGATSVMILTGLGKRLTNLATAMRLPGPSPHPPVIRKRTSSTLALLRIRRLRGARRTQTSPSWRRLSRGDSSRFTSPRGRVRMRRTVRLRTLARLIPSICASSDRRLTMMTHRTATTRMATSTTTMTVITRSRTLSKIVLRRKISETAPSGPATPSTASLLSRWRLMMPGS